MIGVSLHQKTKYEKYTNDETVDFNVNGLDDIGALIDTFAHVTEDSDIHVDIYLPDKKETADDQV